MNKITVCSMCKDMLWIVIGPISLLYIVELWGEWCTDAVWVLCGGLYTAVWGELPPHLDAAHVEPPGAYGNLQTVSLHCAAGYIALYDGPTHHREAACTGQLAWNWRIDNLCQNIKNYVCSGQRWEDT